MIERITLQNQTIERTTLSQLVYNEEYARKVLPFLKGDYFADKTERTVFEEIQKFVEKYNSVPTQTSLEIEVSDRGDLNESDYKKVIEVIKTLESTEVDYDWLVDTTEKFCKDKACIMRLLTELKLLKEKIKNEMLKLFLVFSLMPCQVGF